MNSGLGSYTDKPPLALGLVISEDLPWGRGVTVAVPDPVRTLPRCAFIQFLWVMADACDTLRISSFPLIPPENGPAP